MSFEPPAAVSSFEFPGPGLPSTISIFARRNLACATVTGVVTMDSLSTLLSDYLAHPESQPSFDFLIDVSAVTAVNLSFGNMQTFVDHQTAALADRDNAAKTALYAPSDLAFGFARMYVSINAELSARPVAAFRSRHKTTRFLDRPYDPAYFSKTAMPQDLD